MYRNRRHRPSQRPGTPRGRRGAPRGILPGPPGAPRASLPRASAGGAACQLRTPRGVANSREPEARPRHGHCACCGCRSCPEGSPGGHRTPGTAPQCFLITRTNTPAASPSCPLHGHYGSTPGVTAAWAGSLRAAQGTQGVPLGPPEGTTTHPSPPQAHEPANQGQLQKDAPLAHSYLCIVQQVQPSSQRQHMSCPRHALVSVRICTLVVTSYCEVHRASSLTAHMQCTRRAARGRGAVCSLSVPKYTSRRMSYPPSTTGIHKHPCHSGLCRIRVHTRHPSPCPACAAGPTAPRCRHPPRGCASASVC